MLVAGYRERRRTLLTVPGMAYAVILIPVVAQEGFPDLFYWVRKSGTVWGTRNSFIPCKKLIYNRNFCRNSDGGAERDRTAGLVIANDALSQLSYSPIRLII